MDCWRRPVRHIVARLHAEEPKNAGIIVCSLDLDFERQPARIDQVVATSESIAGRLIRVNRPET